MFAFHFVLGGFKKVSSIEDYMHKEQNQLLQRFYKHILKNPLTNSSGNIWLNLRKELYSLYSWKFTNGKLEINCNFILLNSFHRVFKNNIIISHHCRNHKEFPCLVSQKKSRYSWHYLVHYMDILLTRQCFQLCGDWGRTFSMKACLCPSAQNKLHKDVAWWIRWFGVE